jgi:autotransporter-associated beta strand protein
MRFPATQRGDDSTWRKTMSPRHSIRNHFLKRLCFESLEDRRLLTTGIGDFVWSDLNGNGLQDLNEAGLAGAGVELHSSADATVGNADDVLIAQAVTDAAGHYSFDNLSSGVNYYLTFRLPSAYTFTSKDAGGDDALDSDANSAGITNLFTMSPDEINLNLDAGVVGSASGFGWASSGGGANDEYGRAVAADTEGNIYVAGTFYATADFDPGPGVYNLTPLGGTNVFAAKFSSTGALLWVRGFSGGDFDSRCQIALDSAGNVFVTGAFSGAADFDPGIGSFTLNSAGGDDIFVSKLDPAGNLIWAKSMGGSEDDYGLGIAISSDGSILTTGSFQGTADFDPGTDIFNLTSPEDYAYADIFVSKLDAAGDFVWARQIGGFGDDYGNSIAVGSDGSVYITGSFQYWADFDPGAGYSYLESAGYADIFVTKLDAAGNLVWARQMGGAEFDSGNSIAVANDGSVFTTGYFRVTADFNPDDATYNLTSAGSRDIFISKLDNSGNFVWAVRMGSSGTDTGYCLAVDNYRDVYSTGYFQGAVDFNPGSGTSNLNSAGGEDIYISKLDESGNFIWAKRMGGSNYDVGYAIAVRSDQSVFTTGYFQGTVDFDPGTSVFNRISSGGTDFFLSELFIQPPTDIQLSAAVVSEHEPIYTDVGVLSTTDPNPSATTWTYTLVAGEGADDNACFTISGDQLKTNTVLDYESQSAYSIRIRSRNNAGACCDKTFIITATDAEEMSIGDLVWNDLDANGVQDAGEPGIENVNVKLYYSADATIGNSDDRLIDETITNAQGEYVLHKVAYGMNLYLVFNSLTPYLTYTAQDSGGNDDADSDADASGYTGLFTLAAGQHDNSRDAGFIGSPLENGWAISVGGLHIEKSMSVATDDEGNAYVTGYFSGTMDFDPGPGTYNLICKGVYDIFVAKYSPSGTLLWAESMGDTAYDFGNSIVVGKYGLIYVTGAFSGTVDFYPGSGTFNLTSAGGLDIFVAIFDADGDFYYAWSMGGTGTDQGLSFALGSDGSMLTTGYFSGTANFDPWGGTYNLTSAGGTDVFVVKMDNNWDLAWARRMGGSGADQGLSIAVTNEGNVVTSGYFSSTADFDPGSGTYNLTSAGSSDIFVSELDAEGNFVWARGMGGTGADQALSLAATSEGGVVTTGFFSSTVDFDPGDGTFNLTCAGGNDVFVSKLDAAGNFVWARRMGGSGTDQSYSLTLGSEGELLTTGYFSGVADFDPGDGTFNLTSAGNADIFISKLDAAGNFLGAWRIGGTGLDNGVCLVSGSEESILTTGLFSGVVDFNLGPEASYLTSVGTSNIYLAKYYLNAPSDIQLSSNSVLENQPLGTLVGTLLTTDPDSGESFSYELVAGEGDVDNGLFLIDDNQLKTNAIFDYETKSSYSIRVLTRDNGGQGFEKTLTVTIVDQNDPPATRIWNGGGGDNLWMNPQNWLGGEAPLPGDDLLFPEDGAQKECVNDYASQTAFQSIVFTGTGYELSGNAVLLTMGITDSSSGASDNIVALATITLYGPQTIVNLHDQGKLVVQSDINLGNYTLTVEASEATRIEGDINGDGGITKTGGGELTLTGANTYNGDTTVAAGELHTGDIGAHDHPTDSVEVQENAQLWADCIITGTLSIGAGGRLTISLITSGSGTTAAAVTSANLSATAEPESITSDIPAQLTGDDSTSMPIVELSATETSAASVNPVFNCTASTIDDSPTVRLAESFSLRQIEVPRDHLPPQSPMYRWIEYQATSTTLNENQPLNLIGKKEFIDAKDRLFSSMPDGGDSRAEKIDTHSAAIIGGGQKALDEALQSVIHDFGREQAAGQNGQLDQILLPNKHSKKQTKLIEKAIDTIIAADRL